MAEDDAEEKTEEEEDWLPLEFASRIMSSARLSAVTVVDTSDVEAARGG
jgi:hypothetical protein